MSMRRHIYTIAILMLFAGIVAYAADHFFTVENKRSDTLENTIQSGMKTCLYASARDQCYQEFARALLGMGELSAILETLATLNKQNISEYAACHEITHFLGRDAYRARKNIPSVYASCTMACGGGCFHGAMEELLTERYSLEKVLKDDNIIRQELIAICGEEEAYAKLGIYHQCVHGLGHALMFITDGDLLKSLDFCDAFPRIGERKLCYTGIFMENAMSGTNTAPHPSRFLRADDPLYPCNSLAEKYLVSCYTFQTGYFIQKIGKNWQEVVSLCGLIPERYRNFCFQMIGANHMFIASSPEQIKRGCAIVDNPYYRNQCIKGAVFYLNSRFGEGAPPYALRFCNTVDDGNKEICYTEIGRTLSFWMRDHGSMREVCQQAGEKQFIRWCEEGIKQYASISAKEK